MTKDGTTFYRPRKAGRVSPSFDTLELAIACRRQGERLDKGQDSPTLGRRTVGIIAYAVLDVAV